MSSLADLWGSTPYRNNCTVQTVQFNLSPKQMFVKKFLTPASFMKPARLYRQQLRGPFPSSDIVCPVSSPIKKCTIIFRGQIIIVISVFLWYHKGLKFRKYLLDVSAEMSHFCCIFVTQFRFLQNSMIVNGIRLVMYVNGQL